MLVQSLAARRIGYVWELGQQLRNSADKCWARFPKRWRSNRTAHIGPSKTGRSPGPRSLSFAPRQWRGISHANAVTNLLPDSLFADILREQTGSDVALLPGVGYGVAIPEGDITFGMLKNLIPHDSKVVTLRLTGAQIRSIIEQALVNTFTEDPKKKVGGMIRVSGVSFVFQKDGGDSDRARLLHLDFGGKPIGSSHTYKVATNSMLAQGGHNYGAFQQGSDHHEHGNQFGSIEAWMLKAKLVGPPRPGRIQER